MDKNLTIKKRAWKAKKREKKVMMVRIRFKSILTL